MEKVYEVLLNLLRSYGLDVSVDTFKTEAFRSSQFADYNLDSLDIVDLMFTIEEDLGVLIDDQEICYDTLGQFLDSVQTQLEENAA